MSRLGILALCVLASFVAGCTVVSIKGSGDVVTRDEEIRDFDRVSVSHGFDVELRQGDSYGVVVRVDDNLLEYLQVVRRGHTLEIGLKPGNSYNLQDATMEADVTMPELIGLELSGSSDATISGFVFSKALEIDLSGSSSVRGDVGGGADLRLEASGSSDVSLAGSAKDLVLRVSGSSDAELSGLTVVDANIEASGSSSVTVNASGTLTVEASGGSRVRYLGSPTLGSVETSGGATFDRK